MSKIDKGLEKQLNEHYRKIKNVSCKVIDANLAKAKFELGKICENALNSQQKDKVGKNYYIEKKFEDVKSYFEFMEFDPSKLEKQFNEKKLYFDQLNLVSESSINHYYCVLNFFNAYFDNSLQESLELSNQIENKDNAKQAFLSVYKNDCINLDGLNDVVEKLSSTIDKYLFESKYYVSEVGGWSKKQFDHRSKSR